MLECTLKLRIVEELGSESLQVDLSGDKPLTPRGVGQSSGTGGKSRK